MVKMLWDERYFYIGAYLEEPNVWATLTERDSIIYQDNDFEVFIDPDGDTHNYYELEMNALNTVWDLFLVKPYRDGGPAIHAWDIRGLKTAVKIERDAQRPRDKDKGWFVEIAMPWEVLKEAALPKASPKPGDQWRLNFSRVEYRLNVVDGAYAKAADPVSGQALPEDNWVWSPTGLVNIHYPEMWGCCPVLGQNRGTGQGLIRSKARPTTSNGPSAGSTTPNGPSAPTKAFLPATGKRSGSRTKISRSKVSASRRSIHDDGKPFRSGL